jgi:hypothetical protein
MWNQRRIGLRRAGLRDHTRRSSPWPLNGPSTSPLPAKAQGERAAPAGHQVDHPERIAAVRALLLRLELDDVPEILRSLYLGR